MIIRFILGVCLLQASAQYSFAQQADTIRRTDHYVGIQANQLLRQIFNFGGGSASINNPYLIAYSFNNRITRVGMNIGFGFNYDERVTDDQFIDRTTITNDFFFRVGIEKKSTLARKLVLSTGADFVIDLQKSETKTGDLSQPNMDFSTGTKSSGFGLGPRVTLNYAISDKILVGTEANYYFKTFTIKQFQESPGFSDSQQRKTKSFQLNVPAVIFLILKF